METNHDLIHFNVKYLFYSLTLTKVAEYGRLIDT